MTAVEHVRLMADLFGVISDTSRLRILMVLQERGEVSVGDIAEESRINEDVTMSGINRGHTPIPIVRRP